MDEYQVKPKRVGLIFGGVFAILTISMLIAWWITGKSNMPDPVFFDSVAGHTEYSYVDMQLLTECFAYSGETEENAECFYFVLDTSGAPTIVHMSDEQFASYQEIVDFTYSGETSGPDPIRIYGIPRPLDAELSALAAEAFNELWQYEYITEENAVEYFGSMYLDCTADALSEAQANLLVFAFLFFMLSLLFFITTFFKNRRLTIANEQPKTSE